MMQNYNLETSVVAFFSWFKKKDNETWLSLRFGMTNKSIWQKSFFTVTPIKSNNTSSSFLRVSLLKGKLVVHLISIYTLEFFLPNPISRHLPEKLSISNKRCKGLLHFTPCFFTLSTLHIFFVLISNYLTAFT